MDRRERWLLGIQTATLVAMALSVATKVWQDHYWFGFVLVGTAAIAWAPEFRARRRERLGWFAYVAGIFVYTLLRALADETFVPIRTDYVIRLDHWFPGPSPVEWAQEARLEHGPSKVIDYVAILTHWSFFIVPHAGAVAVFWLRRTLFASYVALLVIIMWLGLALFFLLPTVPPWLAGEQGDLPGVTRVMDSTIRDSLGEGGELPAGESAYDEFYEALGEPNPVAAMPSIHMAVTFGMFLWALRYAGRFALPLLVYTVAMGVALIYLGEHYFADEVAGLLVAALAWVLVLKVTKFAPAPDQAAR